LKRQRRPHTRRQDSLIPRVLARGKAWARALKKSRRPPTQVLLSLRWVLLLPLLLGVIALLPGSVGDGLWQRWASLWGWGAWPLSLLLAVFAWQPTLLTALREQDPRWLLGLELLLWGSAVLVSLYSQDTKAGWIAWATAWVLTRVLGVSAARGVAWIWVLASLYLVLRFLPWTLDRQVFWEWWVWIRAQIGPWLGWHLPSRPRVQSPSLWSRARREARQQLVRLHRHLARPSSSTPPQPTIETDYGLPPLSLLEMDEYGEGLSQDVRRQADLIRRTLEGFRVPVRIVEINQGPAVTQFCVQPLSIKRGGKVRRISVRQILAHQEDLALVLAASPLRIEAPVPGKPYVGIEVPNKQIAVVRLGGLLRTEAFQRIRSPLALALGRDVTGHPVVSDLTKLPHLLIAGATGSGKSVAIASMLVTWLMRNTPHDLRLLLIDPKRVELSVFNGIPHLLGRVVTEVDDVLRALTWVTLQMDDRYRMFRRAKVRNIDGYNMWARANKKPTLPYIAVVVDELADIMLATKGEVEYMLARLAQMARATGIHLVVATQRPSVDVITGLIKANFPARLAFAVASQVDSRVILDAPGAEALLGRGDALFHPPDRPSPIRLQGAYVSDEEIERVVQWWLAHGGEPEGPSVPWAHIELEGEKPLIEQAIELIRGQERVSASFLQRRLRISFKRAQQLIEELEAMGWVGPDEGGGQGRLVLGPDQGRDGVDV